MHHRPWPVLFLREVDGTADEEGAMWDTAEATQMVHLSHAVPCTRCGHEAHQFLACSDTCTCDPPALPWLPQRVAAA